MINTLPVPHAVDHRLADVQGTLGLMRHEDVSVVVVASRVDVETVVVDKRGQFLENYPVPFAPAVLATAYQLDARIRPFHYLGELNRLFGVILCAQGPDLPPPVHLVAESPVFHLVGLLVTIAAAQVCPIGITRAVAVLNPRLGLIHCAGSHIDADVRLRAEGPAVLDEFVGSESVGLLCVPGKVHATGTLFHRPHTIRPVIATHKITTRPA